VIILKNWTIEVQQNENSIWLRITAPNKDSLHVPVVCHGGDGFPAAKILNALKEDLGGPAQKCNADMWADPPRDCDFPFCGCDPSANAALEAVSRELKKAELFDWLAQKANITWSLDYENVDITFPLSAESFTDLQDAVHQAIEAETTSIQIPPYKKQE
jgi:hypothetical protein